MFYSIPLPRRPRGKQQPATPDVQRRRSTSRRRTHRGVAMETSPLIPQVPRRREASRARARTRKLDCASCGKPITHHAGRRPSYCSARCRMREFGKGRTRKALLGGYTGAPTKHQKIDSNNNALRRSKTQSSTRIVGPASVLAIEVFGRAWQSRISSGGVAIEVAQLRPRALVNWGRQ
jgi:hypothetical protein